MVQIVGLPRSLEKPEVPAHVLPIIVLFFCFCFFKITMCTLHGRMVPWVQQGAVRFPSLEMEPGTALFFFVPICFIHSRGIVQRPMLASSTITIGSWVPPTPRARRKQEPRSIASWFLSAAKASIFLSWPIKVSFVYRQHTAESLPVLFINRCLSLKSPVFLRLACHARSIVASLRSATLLSVKRVSHEQGSSRLFEKM